ncbi:MAG: hypothetical protein J5817_01280 [Treponema sp.]|nr:hypothetical protein [Treponema sp.]
MNKRIMVSSVGFVLAAFAMSGISFAQEATAPKAGPDAKAPAEVVRPAPKEIAPKENLGEKKLKKDLPPKAKKTPPAVQPGEKGKMLPKPNADGKKFDGPRGKMNGKGFRKPRSNRGCNCCGCCGRKNFDGPRGKMMPMPKDGKNKFPGKEFNKDRKKDFPGKKFPGGEFKKGELKEGEVPAPKPVAPKEAPKDAGEKKVK